MTFIHKSQDNNELSSEHLRSKIADVDGIVAAEFLKIQPITKSPWSRGRIGISAWSILA